MEKKAQLNQNRIPLYVKIVSGCNPSRVRALADNRSIGNFPRFMDLTVPEGFLQETFRREKRINVVGRGHLPYYPLEKSEKG